MILQFKRKKEMEIPKEFDEKLEHLAMEYMKVCIEMYNQMLGDEFTDVEYQKAVKLVAGRLVEECEKAGAKLGAEY